MDGTFEILDEVVYLRDAGADLMGRLYQPAGPGPFPLLLQVHGGVWNNGSRGSHATTCSYLASAGIGVFSIDFRQAPQHRYPQSIADIHYGLRWLKANAARFRGRPDWVGGLGMSSGGHQLLLATLRADDPRYCTIDSADVAGVSAAVEYVVLCWPVTDPLGRYRWAQRAARETLVVRHDAYWPSTIDMEEGSPQRIVESIARHDPTTRLPRAMLIYGTNDGNVPRHLTDAFVTAYRAAGGCIDCVPFDGMPHSFIDADPHTTDVRQALARMADFVHQRTTGG